jgi:hypothetical protein
LRIMLLWNWEYKYLLKSLFPVLWGHIPRNGIAGSYDNPMFNFLKNCHSVVHMGFIISYSLLMGMKWYLIVILIYLSLKTKNIEHLFTNLFMGHLYIFRKMFKFLPPFEYGCFIAVVVELCYLLFQTQSLKCCISFASWCVFKSGWWIMPYYAWITQSFLQVDCHCPLQDGSFVANYA